MRSYTFTQKKLFYISCCLYLTISCCTLHIVLHCVNKCMYLLLIYYVFNSSHFLWITTATSAQYVVEWTTDIYLSRSRYKNKVRESPVAPVRPPDSLHPFFLLLQIDFGDWWTDGRNVIVYRLLKYVRPRTYMPTMSTTTGYTGALASWEEDYVSTCDGQNSATIWFSFHTDSAKQLQLWG